MRLIKRLLLALIVVVALLAAVLIFRTITFKPPFTTPTGLTLAAAPAYDLTAAANRLGEAIRIKTISYDDDAKADPAARQAMLDWVQKTYPQSMAVMSRELAASYTAIYTWPGSDASLAPIILMAHQDVVPVDEATAANWKHPAFDGVVADGAVWGRGAVDDKGSLVSIFEATEALAASGFKPKRTLIIINGHDEEAGQTGAKAAAEALKAKGVLAEFVLDEGMLTIADFPLTKKPAALIGIAEKGYATLDIVAKSAGGHSSMPPKQTAVDTLARAVVAIAGSPDPMSLSGPGALTVKTMAAHTGFGIRLAVANDWLFAPVLISEFAKTNAGAALLHTTMAPTMLAGSPKENVLPQQATATINYRIVPGQTSADVLARAEAAVDGLPVELAWRGGNLKEPSPVSSTDSRGFGILAALASEGGGTPVAPGLVVAATDSSNMNAVAKDIYRYQPLLLALDETTMIHGVNEHLTLENYKRMIEFYARLIATAAAE